MKKAHKRSRKPVKRTPGSGGGIVAFIVLAGFICLAMKAWDYRDVNHGYSHDDIDALGRLIESSTAPSAPASTFALRRAAALKDVYFLSDADVVAPVRIYQER